MKQCVYKEIDDTKKVLWDQDGQRQEERAASISAAVVKGDLSIEKSYSNYQLWPEDSGLLWGGRWTSG